MFGRTFLVLLSASFLQVGCRSAAAPSARTGHIHRVAKSETLYSIGRRYGVHPNEIARLNRIEDPRFLQPGQQLLIPDDAGMPPAVHPEWKPDPEPNDPDVGESPPALARRADPQTDCGSARANPVRADRMLWPVDGVVVSKFGRRDGDRHDGIDIAAPLGSPIWAAQKGSVVFAGRRPGYGAMVIVEHPDRTVSIYAHNAENCVQTGQSVNQGEVVGLVGHSGGSAAPQLHFEVRVKTKAVNPRARLDG